MSYGRQSEVDFEGEGELLEVVAQPNDGRRTLTREAALVYLTVIAGAGNHTTNRLISWTAKVLADNPDARRELVENPAFTSRGRTAAT